MTKLIWKNITVKLGDLKPWAMNPRYSTKAQAERLLESFREFGQVQTVAVGPDMGVYDGHQRLSALMTLFGGDYELDARQSNRALTEEERRKLVITLHAGAVGSWDWDNLSSWDAPELINWGFDGAALKDWKRDAEALGELLNSEGNDTEYVRNTLAPIYTPKGEKPDIRELYDDAKTKQMVEEIDSMELKDDEKEFLRVAARRHTVLNYKRIAEYYCHASKEVQKLMEDSALIIIDFNRSIELGYVKLSEAVANQYKEEFGDA